MNKKNQNALDAAMEAEMKSSLLAIASHERLVDLQEKLKKTRHVISRNVIILTVSRPVYVMKSLPVSERLICGLY